MAKLDHVQEGSYSGVLCDCIVVYLRLLLCTVPGCTGIYNNHEFDIIEFDIICILINDINNIILFVFLVFTCINQLEQIWCQHCLNK